MPVPVMQVRVVRMGMPRRVVSVPVRVWLRQAAIVSVMMMMVLVVHVAVLVLQRLVGMLMLVPLGEVKP